jgi:hypothetical protein
MDGFGKAEERAGRLTQVIAQCESQGKEISDRLDKLARRFRAAVRSLEEEGEWKERLQRAIEDEKKATDLESERAKLLVQIEEFDRRADLLEAQEILEISLMNGSNGKKLYPNAESRESALLVWKDQDQEYCNLQREVASLRMQVLQVELDAKKLRSESKGLMQYVKMIEARLCSISRI